MSCRSILVAATGLEQDVASLFTAARFARAFEARLRIIPLFPDSAADLVYLGATLGAPVPAEAVAMITAAEHDVQARVEREARLAAERAGLPIDGPSGPGVVVQQRGLAPWLALEAALPLADLLIADAAATCQGPVAGPVANALLAARAPLLVVRPSAPEAFGGSAAIAWDGSAEAGRAVRAGLPLLHRASGISVLQAPLSAYARHHSAADPERLLHYLHLHGLAAGVVRVSGEQEGSALLDAAQELGASLLISGAWGHSRLRETVFGGATRTFLHAEEGPNVLLHH